MPAEIVFIIEAFSAFWKIIFPYLLALKALIFQFWWTIIPFYFFKHLKFIYSVFIADRWAGDKIRKPIVLEVRIPQDVIRPLRAMENVFNSIWGSYDPPKDWRASHFEGKIILGTSFEIAGIDGVPHMYIRLPSSNRKLVESAIYAQYPEVEIIEVPDYTKQIPGDVPNEEWDMWGTDFQLMKSDVYPLKTYEQFFEEKPEGKEEKRIDPLSSLFETISRMSEGEQLWIQIVAQPRSPKETTLFDRAKKEVDKLVKRVEKPEKRTLLADFFYLLIHGEIPVQEKKEETVLPPEMKLTAGERDIVTAIERKKSKHCFKCFIKYAYIAKRKVFFGGAKGFGVSFFAQFGTQNLNNTKPWSLTTTKVQSPDIFTARRLYLKKRDLVDFYRKRAPAFDPFDVDGATYYLNSEELATLWHFPGAAVPTAALKRVEMKKGAPPSTLPVE
ncbi:MAG: hypothetical protein WC319_04840 [Candidatus Paceibacterota bacterium]|jgi:hypothetical protein